MKKIYNPKNVFLFTILIATLSISSESYARKKVAKQEDGVVTQELVLSQPAPVVPVQGARDTTKKQVKLKDDPNEPKIRVLLGRGKRGVKSMPIETYLAGVIGNEMNRNWPKEALKAQAVAARSYALHQMEQARKDGRHFDIVTTQADQVFRIKDIKNQYLKDIVAETKGEVLWKNDEVVEAFYSSTCGGKTRAARMAGLSYKDYCQNISNDEFCRISPHRHWSFSVSTEDLAEKLTKGGVPISSIKQIKVLKKDVKAGYVQEVFLKGENGKEVVRSAKIRNVLGYMNIKSHRYTVKKQGDTIYFSGYGFGHGVGLCQFGAKGMAVKDKGYHEILTKYYPNVEIRKLY